MMNKWQIGLAAALLVSSSGIAANAQSFYTHIDRDRHFGWDHGRHLGFDNRFNRFDRFNRFNQFDRLSNVRQMQFENRVARARADISRSLAMGRISPMRAANLNDRLDSIVSRESMLDNNGLSAGELANLESRLVNIELAARAGVRFY